MKILIFNYEFPPVGGGGGHASYQIGRQLADRGHQILVVTSRFKNLPNREEIYPGLVVQRISSLRRRIDRCSVFEMASYVIVGLMRLPSIIKDFKPNAAIAFFSLPSGLLAWAAKLFYGIPYIVSFRGGDVPGFSAGLGLRVYHFLTKPLNRAVCRSARHLVANSAGLKRLVEKFIRNRNIECIPNGIDTDQFHPGNRKVPVVFTILSVGRLSKQKGLDILIKAIKTLVNDGLKVKTFIAGDGPEAPALRKLCNNLDLTVTIEFTGWLPREQLIPMYRQASAFVLPSYDEGMPNVLLEAMACGLPVIATSVSGSEELVKEGVNGFLVQPGDWNNLAHYLKKLHSSRKLQQSMGLQSRMLAQ